jgi:ectoine hydroxylase-related dioxygenase (phytanoyl-CoA dioxygenase family)
MERPRIQRVNASVGIEAVMGAIDNDGAVIVTRPLEQFDTDRLQREVEVLFGASEFCAGQFFGQKTKRIHSLIAKSSACQRIATHPLILDAMDKILTPFCEKIQINLTQGIQIWPKEVPQILHRDDSMFPANTHTCEFMANAMWACSKFTAQNGGTVLAPGSHKWPDRERQPTENELVHAEMEPGDVLIYLGSLIHAGGGNHSHAPRTGIAIGYCLGWLRQYENQYLAAPLKVAKNFSPILQDLLGYGPSRQSLAVCGDN